jgi:hypothetical protein
VAAKPAEGDAWNLRLQGGLAARPCAGARRRQRQARASERCISMAESVMT